MDPRIGTEFAGHRIEGVIGRGGASVVYLAEHLRLGRKVALKVLAQHLADDEAFRERFIRESRIAAGLDHPNVVTVYDAGEFEGNLYISMRYVEGSDLGRLLGAEGPLEASRTVSILSQIAGALDAAHAQGLVHRDVKPANMLVEAASDMPGFDRAYLSDFGISKRTTSREGLTRTGQFVGTVDYVAPEQITGEPVDGRTDVYSLGCVLFECFSGRVPFPGESGVATIYSHLHDAPPTLEGFGEREAGLNRVVARALAKTRGERYETCGAVIEAIRNELTPAAPTVAMAKPVDTLPTPAPTTDRGSPARGVRRAAWSAGVVAVVVVIGILAFALPGDETGSETGLSGVTTGADEPSVTGPTSATGPTSPIDPNKLAWSAAYPLGSTFSGKGRQAILDALVTTDGVAVAVGHETRMGSSEELAAVWRSVNGRRWKPIRSVSFGTEGHQRMIAVTQFGNLLVAAGWSGSDAAIWTSSTDGRKWTRFTSLSFGGVGFQLIRDVVSIGSELIAVGSSGTTQEQDAAAWSSTDGRQWELIDAPAFEGPGQQEMYAAQVVGSQLFAVGFSSELGDLDAAVWAYEGGTWTRVDPESLRDAGLEVMLDIGGGGELPLVAVGCEDPFDRCDTSNSSASDAVVWTSEDGMVWERVTMDDDVLGGLGQQSMKAVVNYGDSLVAVGIRPSPDGGDIDGALWTSVDGRDWRAPGGLSPTASALGGRGDQSLRAIVVYGYRRIELMGFGVTNEGDVEDAQVWRGIAPLV